METSQPLKKRKIPISSSLPSIRRGVNPRRDPRIVKVDPELLPIISRDPIARKYLRPFVSEKNVYSGEELSCLWIEGVSEAEITASEALKNITREKTERLKNDFSETFSVSDITPQNDFLAIPYSLGNHYEYLPVAKFQPEIIAHYDLGIIDNDYTLALGVVSCRLFRVWKKKAPEYLETATRPGFGTLYNSFPMPDLSIIEKRSIEAGARQVEDARLYFTGRSLRELYQENMKPLQLRNAHKELNAVVFPCFGLSIDADENTIMERLTSYYFMMSNSR